MIKIKVIRNRNLNVLSKIGNYVDGVILDDDVFFGIVILGI